MTEIEKIFDELCRPFPTEQVQWRVGSTNEKYRKPDEDLVGTALAYVDARAVMDRLDSVVGFNNWQNSYSAGVSASIVCNLGISIAGEWIWKADGAGPSDIEAEKGALSDAFKRAAVRFGIGRYLYDLGSPKCRLNDRKQIPRETFAKLDQVHNDFVLKWVRAQGARHDTSRSSNG